jgi:hypothetical protein
MELFILNQLVQTPMVSYVNTHAVLEARRQSAREASSVDGSAASDDTQGPRTIIVGPTDSGEWSWFLRIACPQKKYLLS